MKPVLLLQVLMIKKNFNTAAAFKKVELRTMFLSSVNR